MALFAIKSMYAPLEWTLMDDWVGYIITTYSGLLEYMANVFVEVTNENFY